MPDHARRYDANGSSTELTATQVAKPNAAIAAADRAGGFVWVVLTNPTEWEMAEIGKVFGLHPLAVADAASRKQQPKVQSHPQHLFIVMWVLMYSKPKYDVSVGETFIFTRPGLIVTVQRHDARFRANLVEVLDKPVDPLTGGVARAVYEIMANIARGYTQVSSVIEAELEELEDHVFNEDRRDDSKRIYRLRKQIGKVNRAVPGIAVALPTHVIISPTSPPATKKSRRIAGPDRGPDRHRSAHERPGLCS